MIIEDTNDTALRDYLDALLQEPATRMSTPVDAGMTWLVCRLGRLQLLLPGDATGAPAEIGQVEAIPRDWHLARVRIGKDAWRVLDLARSIAPQLACASVDTLLPVTGTCWLLAVPGRPVPARFPDDAVEWRAHRSSRPWLAGMSRDGQYVTLDVRALIAHAVGGADATHEEGSP